MSGDIATVAYAIGNSIGFDWSFADVDLASDDGLETAVIISLFTDRRAAEDDVLPEAAGDKRGCWMDLPVTANDNDGSKPDLMGSRLWLLERAKATKETAANAQLYVLEALKWLIDDGVAQSIKAETRWIAPDFLGIGLSIARIGSDGSIADRRFDFVWKSAVGG